MFALISKFIKYCDKKAFEKKQRKFGHFGDNIYFSNPQLITSPHKIYIYDNVNILPGAKFIIRSDCETGKVIIKNNATIAADVTICTNNHPTKPILGEYRSDYIKNHKLDKDRDVIIEEDVWIGVNVTILYGVTIGRGAVIGAGSVIRDNVPPYSVVLGNPAKVVSYFFEPEEVIEHEKKLYKEDDRLSLEELEKNYNRFYSEKA